MIGLKELSLVLAQEAPMTSPVSSLRVLDIDKNMH